MAFRSSHASPSTAPSEAPPDKWRLASQLQKAIRHGREDAAGWAVAQLEQVDPNYLRYRLSVIAVEDIAAAQVQEIASAFEGGWGKSAILAKGGVAFLSEFARACARGDKDRLPCNWMSCTRWLEDFQAAHGPWEGVAEEKALVLAFDRARPWWERGLAAWRAAGTKRFSSAVLPVVEGNWQGWKEACGDFASDPSVRLVMAAGEHQREAHPVFLGLAIAERKQVGAILVEPRLPNLPDIGPWLSAAFDKHTADGKRAYRRWLETHPEAAAWLVGRGLDAEGCLDAVGRLAFWLEGGQCNRQWEHPLSRAVLADTKRRYLQTRNMHPQTFAKLCVDPQGWHEARVEVVQGLRPGALRASLPVRP